MKPREEVQVETSNAHNRIVSVTLVGYQKVGCSVPNEGEVIIGRKDRLEEFGGGDEQRDVLDIRVVFLLSLALNVKKDGSMPC